MEKYEDPEAQVVPSQLARNIAGDHSHSSSDTDATPQFGPRTDNIVEAESIHELTAEKSQVAVSTHATSVHATEKDTEEFPEGGWGWMVVLGSFLVLNTTYGMVNTFGVYEVYYLERFPDTKPSIISLVGSLQPTVIYVVAAPVVFLINTLGPSYTIAIGGVIMCFSIMMTSICTAVWQLFLAQGVVFGIGAGITFFTAIAIPPEWFKKKRAYALGLVVSGSSLGGVIWPIAFQRLVDEVGFPWANRIIAFIYLPTILIAASCVRTRFPGRKQRVMPNWSVAKDYRLMIMCLGICVGFFGLFPPLQYIVTYADRLPAPPNIQQYILAILNAMSILGRIGPPYLADKVGRVNVLIISTAIAGILPLVLWLPGHTEPLLLAFAILWGVASGTFIALFPAAIAQLFGLEDNQSRLTIAFISSIPGVMAGSSIAGTFIPSDAHDLTGFNKLIIFSGLLLLGSSLIFAAARFCFTRKIFVFI